MHRTGGVIGFSAALLGAALTLVSCGQPVLFTQISVPALPSMPSIPAFSRPAPPPAVAAVSVAAASTGAELKPGAWTSSAELELRADVPEGAGSDFVVEAEFVPEDQPLIGLPNARGKPGETTVLSPPMRPGQQYHWAVRMRTARGGPGPWTRSEGAVGYQPTPPPAPVIHPLPRSGWIGDRHVQVTVDAEEDPAGVAGLAYSVDQSPAGALPAHIDTQARHLSLTIPKDGDWYVHVRSIDGAGNASPVATLPVHVDSVPLTLEPVKTDPEGGWNPQLGPLKVELKASKPAALSLAILPESSDRPVRVFTFDGQAQVSLTWDGKNSSGQAVPAGKYRFRLDASDKPGRTAQTMLEEPLLVTNKRIVVSLGGQSLTAYEGDKVFLTTLVTTGGPELPTPVGTYRVLEKRYRFKFHSPWPKGSPYWYEDSQTTYALLFEPSGYFIHDAPWRSWFGPGSNVINGRPGADGTGTHGCVNAPFGAAERLYAWADVGTPVIVQR